MLMKMANVVVHVCINHLIYIYNSPFTHSIEEPNINQLNSIDIVITMLSTLGKSSHTDQSNSLDQKFVTQKKIPSFLQI